MPVALLTCAGCRRAEAVCKGSRGGRRRVRRRQQAAAGRAHVHDAVVGAGVQAVVQQVCCPVRLPACQQTCTAQLSGLSGPSCKIPCFNFKNTLDVYWRWPADRDRVQAELHLHKLVLGSQDHQVRHTRSASRSISPKRMPPPNFRPLIG